MFTYVIVGIQRAFTRLMLTRQQPEQAHVWGHTSLRVVMRKAHVLECKWLSLKIIIISQLQGNVVIFVHCFLAPTQNYVGIHTLLLELINKVK